MFLPLYLTFCFFVVLLEGACDCGDQTKEIGNCTVKIHVCGCLEDFEWKYKGQATEEKSGTVGPEAKWYKSEDGAGEHAVVNLFDVLHSCNCVKEKKPVYKCTFDYDVSIYMYTHLPSFLSFFFCCFFLCVPSNIHVLHFAFVICFVFLFYCRKFANHTEIFFFRKIATISNAALFLFLLKLTQKRKVVC